MADQAPAAEKKGGWLKTLLGTLGGLLSGAAVMYLTPLVDRAVKPAKPIANFRVQADGLYARFENLSTGGQGWWDFGDGSPLELVLANQPYISHKYPHPGEYTARMTLRNILGDENERSVSIKLEAPPSTESPRVLSLDVVPLSPGSYAPATFRLVGQVQNAQMVIWSMGEEGQLDPVMDLSRNPEKIVTFPKAGGYTVKLSAFNGNGSQRDEKTEVVTVMDPPSHAVTAILTATDWGSPLETRQHRDTFYERCPQEQPEKTHSFHKVKHASAGFLIKEASVRGANGREIQLGNSPTPGFQEEDLGLSHVRSLRAYLSEDRHEIHLEGELVRPDDAGQNPDAQPGLALPVQWTEQREKAPERAVTAITATLVIPVGGVSSSALLPVPPPPDWVKAERKLRLEVRDGNKVICQEEMHLPQRMSLSLQNHRCLLTATQVNDQLHLDLREEPLVGIR